MWKSVVGPLLHDLVGLLSWVRRSRQVKATADLEAHRRLQQVLQSELGERAVAALKKAMKANPVHALPHTKHKGVGAMWMHKIPNGVYGYMIQVYVPDSGSMYGDRAGMVLDFSVNAIKNEIHALWVPYPKPGVGEETRSLDQFDALLAKACAHVVSWRMFVTDGAKGPSFAQAFGFGHCDELAAS